MKRRRIKRNKKEKRESWLDIELQAALAAASHEEIARTINNAIEAGAIKIDSVGNICPNCKRKFYEDTVCPYCEQNINSPELIREQENIEEEVFDIEEKIQNE